jgi:hypothetical protein
LFTDLRTTHFSPCLLQLLLLQVGPFTWQPYPIFKAVAERGGYEAVTQAGLWRQVSVEWQQGMAKARKQPSPVHIHPVHRVSPPACLPTLGWLARVHLLWQR